MVRGLAALARHSLLFTFAPRTRALALMHAVGQLFPRSDRSPAIEPMAEEALRGKLGAECGPAGWSAGRSHRVARGFYISHAMELVRS